MKILTSQSTLQYLLLKDRDTKLYYIRRTEDKKLALIGNSDDAYDFILYGIEANIKDVQQLKFEKA